MTFIKHFNHKGGFNGSLMIGSAIFIDGKLTIRLPNTKAIVESGYIEDGFGVVTKDVPARKSPYTLLVVKYNKEDLPTELRGQNYKFRICAEQISDNEFVFPFNKAQMVNHK